MDVEALYESELALFQDVIDFICRRNRVTHDEREDFASWALVRVIERDYALFREFEGRSSLRTYLTIATHRLFLDYRAHKWGKYRPCAAARRAAPEGVWLDYSIRRDGFSADEAIARLLAEKRTEKSELELREIVAKFPQRNHRGREMSLDDVLTTLEGGDSPVDGLIRAADAEEKARIASALERVLSTLDSEERVILKMLYDDGRPLCDVARTLGYPEKPFYRVVKRLLKRLKTMLVDYNIDSGNLRLVDDSRDYGENVL